MNTEGTFGRYEGLGWCMWCNDCISFVISPNPA